jgi:hypothetical protein
MEPKPCPKGHDDVFAAMVHIRPGTAILARIGSSAGSVVGRGPNALTGTMLSVHGTIVRANLTDRRKSVFPTTPLGKQEKNDG